ncbi:lysine-specific demethylase JMJ25 isoform X1 [Prunus dulcis]|uniref:lysine-specific demethylase JMJ25 isoform X1 n=1 Tax=Prunus dulcis TaxID=3755 RepID=UPI0014833660|nr:lysine-specific demethylase JMJ25 isoform X1 [Prunus dulcis]XP_034218041.1 lysine-specific demethylase JMJ25 isoform X1 [Prunus dulcis]XP_034218042.1 lysine-specific demethylase JMJ25 isoform X1 [Prunus dulcis]
MDQPRSGNGEENVGIPDDLRCKRSDGKQWRCTAMSMPDKTVCEKHYIQAKKRAANSAMRANLKKAKRKSLGETEIYLESKSDDFDVPLASMKSQDKKYMDKASKNHFRYSPESPPTRGLSMRNPPKPNDERDLEQYEESWRSYKSPPVSALESSRNRPQRSFDANAMTVSEGSESSEETGGQTCHQCRRNDRDTVIWCLRCDRRGYCDSCISTWYSDIPLEDIQRSCPACRGTCNCRVCLRRDNLVKVRIREIPVLDKLQYLHRLLSSVLPIVKQIHQEQCFEVELEKKLRGTDIDLVRTKLNADEQMCCNFCRIPIIDYHWHCSNCAYDVCLNCCRDLREASMPGVEGEVEDNQISEKSQEKETKLQQPKLSKVRLHLSDKFSDWKANSDGSIPCPPKEYGGCGYSSLNLSRIFKMNWVAKLVKNAEEMVSGCRVNDAVSVENFGHDDPRICQYAHREDNNNFLYCPSSEDLKSDGIDHFKRHWLSGEPIIVKQVFDSSSISSWDPMVIWKGIRETADEKLKDEDRMVKAIDFFDWSEVDVELGQFIKGYSEGRINENGCPEMLKLKDWPSPSASEEFLLYQRPEFISKLPLLEYIHSKFGLLNVAAKLPHYSLQNDVGPKIFMSYGTYEELSGGNSVTNLHFNMRDMVYLLVHACEVNPKGLQKTKIESTQKSLEESEVNESPGDLKMGLGEDTNPALSLLSQRVENDYGARSDTDKDESVADHGHETTPTVEGDTRSCELSEREGGDVSEKTHMGVLWDVFRRKDVPKLTEYLRMHWKEFGKLNTETDNFVTWPLYDGTLFLNGYHKRKLKEEFGIEPWSFEQHLGQAVFIPAGCPFQVRNLQSTVQLGLDFLSPESLGEAVRLADEIRCLPNDHEAKLQVLEVGQGKFYLEVGKISLYAASSAIKEIQKLVLDPKFGAELGFEDPNLTAAVSENLEKMTKRRQITCT